MVAANGARRTKPEHPALPVTISEFVMAAKACFEAGAGGTHTHVRDADQSRVLDAGLCRELIVEMARQVPEMAVQITTDAVGRYTPGKQRAVVRTVLPKMAFMALREMVPEGETAEAAKFYFCAYEADITVQHILHAPAELNSLVKLIGSGTLRSGNLQLLSVLGGYAAHQESDPLDLLPFLDALQISELSADWAVCAFGRFETDCLRAAFAEGGKMRVGLENNLLNSLAKYLEEDSR